MVSPELKELAPGTLGIAASRSPQLQRDLESPMVVARELTEILVSLHQSKVPGIKVPFDVPIEENSRDRAGYDECLIPFVSG